MEDEKVTTQVKGVKNKKVVWIFLVLTVVFLILTISTFIIYIISKTNNGKIVLVDMRIAGSEDMLAKVDVSFISGKIATDKTGKSYYLIGDEDHIYLYATEKQLNSDLEEIKKYSYSVIDEKPQSYRVEGVTHYIPEELKKITLEAYNKLFTENTIEDITFEHYFGEVYLEDEIVTDNLESFKFMLFIISFALVLISTIILIVLY
ncbi:MAG: hypothetical protein IJ809_05015 [Clostridia bacterium]|nr:hypothetical protein [Clostridia bacterium]